MCVVGSENVAQLILDSKIAYCLITSNHLLISESSSLPLVNNVGSHSLVYKDNIFPSTSFTLSILVASSTCESAISLDIFSFTLPWNFLSNHSISLTLVCRSAFVTYSTISDSCSIISFDSSGGGRVNASKNMFLMSCNACLCLYSFLSIYCYFILSKEACIKLMSFKVIVAKSKWGITISSSRKVSP